jgi:hypothetical protein
MAKQQANETEHRPGFVILSCLAGVLIGFSAGLVTKGAETQPGMAWNAVAPQAAVEQVTASTR